MIQLPRVLAAAAEVQSFCQERHWPFCFIGGIAVQRWGEPRFTQDVDLTLISGFGGEDSFVDALLRRFCPRRSDAREFALLHRVLLARTKEGVDVDVALGALPFEERSVSRASPWNWGERDSIITCSAEDLIVHKVFAGRNLDWGDVERILTCQFGKLNTAQIHNELAPLLDLKGQPEAMEKLDILFAQTERRLSGDP